MGRPDPQPGGNPKVCRLDGPGVARPGGKGLFPGGHSISIAMSQLFKLRLGGFALAIVLVTLMIGWAAHASWRQFYQLSRKLTGMQIESFKTADQFRANLQQLDYLLLRYTILHDDADRDRFMEEWKKLDHWIDVQ